MKIQIASDLHLELRRGRRPAAGEFRAVADRDLLVLAGDIGRHLNAWGFIKQELARSPVIYVPGNHEYYCWQTRERVDKAWRRKAQQNTDLHYLVAEGVTIAGVRFWGAPWYSDLFGRRAPGYLRDVEYGISDFSPIVSDFGRWTITRHLEEHALQTQLLREQSGQIDVVITHWPPTLHAIAPRFDDDPYNGCFVNDREDLVEEIGAQCWISGHVHDAYRAIVGDTLVLGNPAGFPNAKPESRLFRPDLAIEVEPAMDADA